MRSLGVMRNMMMEFELLHPLYFISATNKNIERMKKKYGKEEINRIYEGVLSSYIKKNWNVESLSIDEANEVFKTINRRLDEFERDKEF